MMNSPCETLIMLMPANCFCQLSRNTIYNQYALAFAECLA